MTTDPPAYIRPPQAARLLGPGRSGRPSHPSRIIRYIVRGAPLRNGGRLHLRGVRFPDGWRTTAAWIEAFLDELTGDQLDQGVAAPPAGPTPARAAARSHRAARAEKELIRGGW